MLTRTNRSRLVSLLVLVAACGSDPEVTSPTDPDRASSTGGAAAPPASPTGSVSASEASPVPSTPCATPLGSTAHVRLCSVTRSPGGVLIGPSTSPLLGKNFQGPNVVRVPSWLPGRLGNYYMYFAAHDGSYIRLAYADAPEGPWSLYEPGTLKDTAVAPFSDTIASPDVHFFDATKTVRMYFHTDKYPGSTEQWSGVAESPDGTTFALASTKNIAKYYMRVFPYGGKVYGIQKGWSTAPAELGVSPDGIAPFVPIKTFAQGSVRHTGVVVEGDTLLVFFSRIGDAPEKLYLSTIDLRSAPSTWELSTPIEVLAPTLDYEGASRPATPSVKGPATNVNELRDPFVLADGAKRYLYYTVAGESGIAMADIHYEVVK